MEDIVIARIVLSSVLDDIKGLMHELTEDELDDLVDALDDVYTGFKLVVEQRNNDKPE
jgi:hypothetical protein